MLCYAVLEQLFIKQRSLLHPNSASIRRIVTSIRQVSSTNHGTSLAWYRRRFSTLISTEKTTAPTLRSLVQIGGKFKSAQIQTSPTSVNTNVTKDVLLYRYENPKYFRRIALFALGQLIFWIYLAEFTYTTLKDIPVPESTDEDLPWWRKINFGETKTRYTVTALTVAVGYIVFFLSCFHIVKSVRYLVLRKGGNEVTFITYSPIGRDRYRTVPLDKMTAKEARQLARVQIPIKVKGDFLHYLIDVRGEFRHPELFDFTAGLKRSI